MEISIHELRSEIRIIDNQLETLLTKKKEKEALIDLIDKNVIPDENLYMRNIKFIKQYVENYLGVDLSVNSRNREIVFARSLYCYLSKRYTVRSLMDIGKLINRDHSTVIYSLKRHDQMMSPPVDKLYYEFINECLGSFENDIKNK